ncbi:hypothetical protein CW702_00955 [Candidatus Bathyarchaeota archaeon]|nr:MAG: hypothetical protein CW702_00955 [Candidatus Bathyarchaeota archaeon]
MGKAVYKVEGGKMLKVWADKQGDKISKVTITGDFFLHPEDLIYDLERSLVGQLLDVDVLERFISRFLKDRGGTLLGASPKDIARCIVMALEDVE